MCSPIVTITLADVSALAVVAAAQSIHNQTVGPDPAHLLIEILAEVGDVENATPIVQVRIHQVFPQASQHGYCELSLVRVHDTLHCEQRLPQEYSTSLMHLNLCNSEHCRKLVNEVPISHPERKQDSPSASFALLQPVLLSRIGDWRAIQRN